MTKTAPLIDIREDHWDIVQGILQKHVPQYEVLAFGSRAKWTAKQYSDLDLAIITDKPLSLDISASLSDDFSESDLPYKVDIVDWATTSESFRKIIEQDKVVVQTRKPRLGVANCWPIVRLEDVTTKLGDGIHGTPEYDDSGDYYFVNGNNLRNGRICVDDKTRRVNFAEYEKHMRILNQRTILVSINGTIGNVAVYSGEKIVLGKSACYFNVRDSVSLHFVRYVISGNIFQNYIQTLATGSTIKNVSLKLMRDFSFFLPPIEEQRAIAHILGTLDDKIELNRKQNETLEAMARALFKAWFVDFEPVRAKMEGRWQRGQSLPGLPAHLYDFFPDRLVDSELGEIPVGWESVPASRLVKFNPSEPLRMGTEAPYIEMAALPTSGSWPEPPVLRPFSSGMRFRNGDTLLARITPCLENGKTAFVQCLPDNTVGWGSTEYIVMRPHLPVPQEFGYLLARDAVFREQAIRSMTGTSGRQRVQADSVAAFKIAAPSNKAVWDAFSSIVTPAFMSIKANAEAIATLTQLRDTLLPKLISGELRVSEVESFIKERGL